MSRQSAGAASALRPAAGLLWQPTQPVFWVTVVCILACIPLQLRAFAEQTGGPTTLWIAAAFGIVQAALLWAIAWILPRIRSQPLSLRVTAFMWGLTVVPVIAVFANNEYFGALRSLGLHSLAASIAAPLDEDTLRFIGVLGILVLASRRHITTMDGLVYGLLVGSGFEVAENLSYILGADDIASTMQVALIRMGIGFGLHSLWTAISGGILAYCLARLQAGRTGRWALLIPGFLVPMILHALWDAPALSVDPRTKFTVLILVYVITLALFIVAVVHGRLPGTVTKHQERLER